MQRTCNAQVAGSSPVSGSNGVIVQLVERLLCKQKVVSSILTGSTIKIAGRTQAYEIIVLWHGFWLALDLTAQV